MSYAPFRKFTTRACTLSSVPRCEGACIAPGLIDRDGSAFLQPATQT